MAEREDLHVRSSCCARFVIANPCGTLLTSWSTAASRDAMNQGPDIGPHEHLAAKGCPLLRDYWAHTT
jgi:hypothetical protein